MSTTVQLPLISSARPEQRPYQPFGSALELIYAKDNEVIVDGPAGTGKSRAALEKIHMVCCKYPMARVLIVRKTRESLTQSAMITFENKVVPSNGLVHWRTTEQQYNYWNGSVVVVGGMDKSSRIMSTDFDLIYVQELTELAEHEYEDLTTRLRNGVVPYQQIIADCNPGPATHWVKRRMDEGKARRIRSTHQDNPQLYDPVKGEWTKLGAAYLAKLQALTGVRRKRLYEGLWVSAEGMVYEEWDENIHLIDKKPIPKEWRRILTVDFGFTNPFVAQGWAIDPDDNMYLYREIYMTQRTVKSHCQDIKDNWGDEVNDLEAIVCDWDAEDRATLEENGLITTAAEKAVSVGIDKVKERMKLKPNGKPSIFIMRDALVERDYRLEDAYKPTHTAEEMEMYVWSDRSTKEQPVKINDHGMDGMRYGVMYVDLYSSNGGIHV